MLAILKAVLGWFTGGVLDRILDTVDKRFDNETERERIKGEIVKEYLQAQSHYLSGRAWFFPLFFVVPLGVWFAGVCLYSLFLCRRCIYPVSWEIAALPSPLNDWAGVIIGGLFIGAGIPSIMRGLRK